MSPATPEADSRWPRFVFTEPSTKRLGPGDAPSPKTASSASSSMGSPSAVPVRGEPRQVRDDLDHDLEVGQVARHDHRRHEDAHQQRLVASRGGRRPERRHGGQCASPAPVRQGRGHGRRAGGRRGPDRHRAATRRHDRRARRGERRERRGRAGPPRPAGAVPDGVRRRRARRGAGAPPQPVGRRRWSATRTPSSAPRRPWPRSRRTAARRTPSTSTGGWAAIPDVSPVVVHTCSIGRCWSPEPPTYAGCSRPCAPTRPSATTSTPGRP